MAFALAVNSGNLEEVQRIATLVHPDSWDPLEFSEVLIPSALISKNFEIAKFLIELGLRFKPHYSDCYPCTSNLHLAVRYANVEIIKLIVQKGFSLHMKDRHGFPPFYSLALRDRVDEECEEIVDYFSNEGINIDTKEPNTGFSLLHFAVKENNVDIIKFLLRRKCNINAKSFNGLTALHVAVIEEFPIIVSLLLGAGAVHNTEDEHKRTPMSLAVENENREIIKILFSHELNFRNVRCIQSSILTNNFVLCYCATIMGMKAIVASALPEIVDINKHFSQTGKTLLHAAAENGHEDIVRMLLRSGANPNTKQKDEKNICATPLHLAAENGHAEAVRVLLSFKASPESMDYIGRTPLSAAAKGGSVDVARYFLKSECPFSSMFTPTYVNFRTPIYDAISEGHTGLVNLFLEQGVCPNYCDYDGLTPLHLAVEKSNIEIAKMLLMKGATIDSEAMTDIPLLHHALEKGVDEKMIRFILSLGVDVDARNKQGLTPLQWILLYKDQSHLIQLFLDYGAIVNATIGNDGLSALDFAVIYQSYEEVNLLLLHGLDINKVDVYGNTVYKNVFDVIQLRLNHYNDCTEELHLFNQQQCDLINFKDCSYLHSEFGHPSLLGTLLPTLRIMTENIARLMADNKHVDPLNLEILSHPFVYLYYKLCTDEIERMKICELETGTPYFTILTSTKFKLANCQADKVTEAFKREAIFDSFPIYANYLLSRVRIGVEMRNLIKKSMNLMRNRLGLPLSAIFVVISKLNELDFKKFCIAFEPIQDR